MEQLIELLGKLYQLAGQLTILSNKINRIADELTLLNMNEIEE